MLAFGNIGFWQLLIVLAVLLLLFGSSRLPKMARSLGQSLTEFKRGLKESTSEDDPKKVDRGQSDAEGAGEDVKSAEDAKSD